MMQDKIVKNCKPWIIEKISVHIIMNDIVADMIYDKIVFSAFRQRRKIRMLVKLAVLNDKFIIGRMILIDEIEIHTYSSNMRDQVLIIIGDSRLYRLHGSETGYLQFYLSQDLPNVPLKITSFAGFLTLCGCLSSGWGYPTVKRVTMSILSGISSIFFASM